MMTRSDGSYVIACFSARIACAYSLLSKEPEPIIITGLRAGIEYAQAREETLSILLFFLRRAKGAPDRGSTPEPCFRWIRRRGP